MRRPRLQAAITGKAGKQRELGPEASHERNVLAITRRIHTKAARLRRLTEEAKQLRAELRADRRELRLVLEAGGKCDAVDAVINRQERGPQ